MAKKAQIGDIFEIPTKKGMAYAQFSHYHATPPKYGALIRVLPGMHSERPNHFQPLADKKELFSTFFPLQAALNRKIFSVVGHADVPLQARKFPLFRNGNINQQTRKVDEWWLWDGTKSWKIGQLNDEQLDLPIESIWNDTCLVERIEEGWTPRLSESLRQAAWLKSKFEKTPLGETAAKKVRHYLLFPDNEAANSAARKIQDAGMQSETMDTGNEWTVVVNQSEPITEQSVEEYTRNLLDICRGLNGKYDSWEIPV